MIVKRTEEEKETWICNFGLQEQHKSVQMEVRFVVGSLLGQWRARLVNKNDKDVFIFLYKNTF